MTEYSGVLKLACGWISVSAAAGLLISCASSSPGFSLIEGKKTGELDFLIEQDEVLGKMQRIAFAPGSLTGPYKLSLSHKGRHVKSCEEAEWESSFVLTSPQPGTMSVERVIAPRHAVTCTLRQVYDTMEIDVFTAGERVSRYRFVKKDSENYKR
jgi:hypothetical protein